MKKKATQSQHVNATDSLDTPDHHTSPELDYDTTTHFGYQKVATDAKSSMVGQVFHSVASKYDIMNDLMSLGIHRLWKRVAIELSGARRGHRILDLAGGTGDLAMKFSRIVGPDGLITLTDINNSMLRVGRDRLYDKGCSNNVEVVQADAEQLPFPDNHFNCVTISFGLRNVTRKQKALEEMARVLKPGGRALILEFSHPNSALFSKVYDAYSFNVLPTLGKLIANDPDSYRYLAESIRVHPNQDTLMEMMYHAGFQRCDYHNLTGGIVALHRGFKI